MGRRSAFPFGSQQAERVTSVKESFDAVIVGAGQAGLSLSHELAAAGVDQIVLERGRVGETWRGRWDSFCLVIPNWTVQLPGGRYRGSEPDGFMPKNDIVNHLVTYAESFRAPVHEGVTVTSLERGQHEGFLLRTSSGEIRAKDVVLASGGYQKAHRPPAAAQLPASVHAIDAEDYSNPTALSPGKVLIVGSGQTGCQLAEEIFEAGRDVSLACGRAPWVPRRLEGRDTIAWINETPFFDARLSDLPSPRWRLLSNPLMSGRRGGHDLNYRTLQAQGVQLLGRFIGAADGRAHFAGDLGESVAFGDARWADIREVIRKACDARSVRTPEMAPPPPFVADAPESLGLSEFGTVIFTSGFRPDYASWVKFPQAFDDEGFPIQVDGSSTAVPGLHFMGVHFQRKRKSATFLGVAEDATVLAEAISAG
jgi:putative flavoprotein involved in K+ transport